MSNAAVNAVTGICFALLTCELIYVFYNLVFKDRRGTLAFLRNFKKGRCAIVYVIAIPLYLIGHLYVGTNFPEAFFSAVNQCVNLVVLKYSTSTVSQLLAENSFYFATVYYCFAVVGVNAVLFVTSLAGQRLWRTAQATRVRFGKKEKLYIFGWNEGSAHIYASDDKRAKLIVDKLSPEECEALFVKKMAYVSCKAKAYISVIFGDIFKSKSKYVIVINEDSDEENVDLCGEFVRGIEKAVKENGSKADDLFRRLEIYVFGDPRYEGIYTDMLSKTYGCLRYVNKYRTVAVDFVKKYPFASFMDERHIDRSSALVKDGVEINAVFIGFGKTNRQIFLTSVANNQFITEGADGIEIKQVKYHIFDKNAAENNKNLNHTYYRFRTEMKNADKSEYLPMPQLPAQEFYHQADINEVKFYDEIEKIVTAGANDVNFIVIAFGNDFENIDLAHKLIEKRREWGANVNIFVKIRREYDGISLFDGKECYVIGNESKCVYDIHTLKGSVLYNMARMRDEIYALEYMVTSEGRAPSEEDIERCRKDTYKAWFRDKLPLERESNLYCCLSLRSKLNMMGLDYRKKEEQGEALSEEEYAAIYAKDFPIDKSSYDRDVEGKKIIRYDLNFLPSLRTNLAVQEHLRWNSYMISKGMIPATIEQIKNEKDEKGKPTKGKNYRLRRHGNITTQEGLVKFRKIVALITSKSEEECDVIKYDYQIMDDAFWLLDKNGYKIVRK